MRPYDALLSCGGHQGSECERIQGFPDNWTIIEWNAKSLGECLDSKRYKAIGNSMAVPVMRWIGRRIQMNCPGKKDSH